eukprot:124893-Chlamydomonas_euryale.AAC.1
MSTANELTAVPSAPAHAPRSHVVVVSAWPVPSTHKKPTALTAVLGAPAPSACAGRTSSSSAPPTRRRRRAC